MCHAWFLSVVELVRSSRSAEPVEHGEHGLMPVESVEVEAGGAAREQLGGEPGGVVDAELGLRLGVRLDLERRWRGRSARFTPVSSSEPVRAGRASAPA